MDEAEKEALDVELERVSGRIRRWREEAGLTQQQLAERAGVAASTVHKVEASQMIPTVAVLLKIARGLGRTPSEFISAEKTGLDLIHLSPEERHPVGAKDHMMLERLTGDLFDPEVEVWQVTLQPGHGIGRGRIRYEGEQAVYCLEGEFTFHVGERDLTLRAGDSLHFKATQPHGWENATAGPARFILIGTVPIALRAALHERIRAFTTDRLEGSA